MFVRRLQCLLLLLFFFYYTHNAYAREVIVIKKGKPLVEQVSNANVEYRLHDDFDLHGLTLQIPKNCIIKGGNNSLSNGLIKVSDGCEVSDLDFYHANLTLSCVANVKIKDCSFIGNISIHDIKEQNFSAAAIFGTDIKDINLESIRIQGYQWGISILKSSNLKVKNIDFVGVMDAPIDFVNNILNANYHDAVHIAKSHFCIISNVSATNCGACVLLGGSSNSNIIEGCKGDVLWDNGVYISSGHNNIVQNCVFRNVRGSGVKARGNCNVLANNSVVNVGTGYVVTGFGPSIGKDELGKDYNGYGSIINGNVVQNPKFYGIAIGSHGGFPVYRCAAINNSITNCDEKGSAISVFCNYATITGNNVNCPKSSGIIVAQVKDSSSGGYLISNNNILSYRKGIVLQKCSNATVSNNVVAAEKQGIVVFSTEESSFILNKLSGKGKYSISGSKKGTSNLYKTFGESDSLSPSEFVKIER